MCGIAGLIRLTDAGRDGGVIEKMTAAVAHRGPDGSGIDFYRDSHDGNRRSATNGSADWRIALGHRRLSILDLSDAGRQPMSYRGRLWITFNGEIYNYVELRRELETLGHEFPITNRYGSHPRRVRRVGHGLLRAAPRHVGTGAHRRPAADGHHFARPFGNQAGLLGQDERSHRNRVRNQAIRRDARLQPSRRMNRSYATICGPVTSSRDARSLPELSRCPREPGKRST